VAKAVKKQKAKNLIFPPSVNNQIILLIRLIHLIPDRAPYVEYSERYSCFNFFNYFLIIFVCANFPEKDSKKKSSNRPLSECITRVGTFRKAQFPLGSYMTIVAPLVTAL